MDVVVLFGKINTCLIKHNCTMSPKFQALVDISPFEGKSWRRLKCVGRHMSIMHFRLGLCEELRRMSVHL